MIQDFSIWEYEAYQRTWDICIIGSGINGLSTGISILERKPDARVLIVDRWFIPLGASTRNAGFSCFGSPSEILDDIALMGEEAALSLVRKRWQGLQKLKTRLMDSKAQYETHGGYELYNDADFESIQTRLTYLNRLIETSIGQAGVFRQVTVPPGIRGFTKAIFNPHEGQLHPGHMIEHLRKMYIRLGGKIWTGLQIDAIEDQDNCVVLRSKVAFPVEAKQVLVTTNAFAADLIPELYVHGARNHVMVTDPVPGLSWKGGFHYDRGFYYFRNIGNRILLGGARNVDLLNENTNQFGNNGIVTEALENFLYTHLAEKTSCKIAFRWSGIIAVGSQKFPIIKAMSPRLFVGVRCAGMGIALASLIGEELTDLALQQ